MFKYAFVVFVIFLVLQLCGEIDWICWWIFSPMWIPVAGSLILIVAFILALTREIMKTRHGRK